jgi:adenine deaminase
MSEPASIALESFADIKAAQALAPVDLLLKNCRLVNVCSLEIHPADIAIRGSKIVAIRENFAGDAARTIDFANHYAVPSFVQLYRGFESPAISGVATWIVEPGSQIPTSGNSESGQPRSTRFVPASTDRSHLGSHRLCSTAEDAISAIRSGSTVFLATSREPDSLAATLAEIRLKGIDTSRICLCLPEPGDASGLIRTALSNEFTAPKIFQMLSLNHARYFALDHEIGSIAPARKADILLSKSLDPFVPASIIFDGQLVLHEGHACA